MKPFENTLLLSDLDGTLLQDDGSISRENRQAISRYIAGGGRFSVATGRSKTGMEHFFPQLEVNAPAILYNGALIYDFSVHADVDARPVGEAGFRLCKALQREFPAAGIEVYAGHRPCVVQDSPRTRLHFQNVKMPWNLCPPEEIPQPWLSLVVTGEEQWLPDVAAFARRTFPGQFFLQLSSPHMLEILSAGANKGRAARRLCSLLKIPPERLYTVGDGPNDLELLAASPHGAAPADGCPQALAAARNRLPPHHDHAIAALIHQIEKGCLL